MYEVSRVNVKVERRSTFTFTRGLSYIACISFTLVKFTCVRTQKLRDSGNQPIEAYWISAGSFVAAVWCRPHLFAPMEWH